MKPFNYCRTFLWLPAAILIACLCATRPASATVAQWSGQNDNWTRAEQWLLTPTFQGDEKYYPQNDNPYGARYQVFIHSGHVALNLNPIIDYLEVKNGYLDRYQNQANTVTSLGGITLENAGLSVNVVSKGGVALNKAVTLDGASITNDSGAWGTFNDAAIPVKNGSVINNAGDITVSVSNLHAQSRFAHDGGARSTFNNSGHFNLTLSDAAYTFTMGDINFRNTGQVEVYRGTLVFTHSLDSQPAGGTYDLGAQGTVKFAGDNFQVMNFGPECRFSGLGTVEFTWGNTTNIDHSVFEAKTLISGSTVNGAFETQKALSWTGGILNANVTARGGLNMDSGGYLTMGGTLTNVEGQIANFTNGRLRLKPGAAFINNGVLNATDQAGGATIDAEGTMRFENTGTLNIALADAGRIFEIDHMPFHNTGTVNIQQGTLRLSYAADTVPMGGTYNISSDAKLWFDSTSRIYSLGPDCRISGDGTVQFGYGEVYIDHSLINAPALFYNGTVRGSFDAEKLVTWSGGVLRGDMVAKGGIIWPSGASASIIGGTVTLPAGQVAELHDNNYRLSLSEGGAFINQGTLNATGSQIAHGGGAATTFDNQGTFNVNLADTSRTFTIQGGTTTFRNSGTVNVIRGKLQFGSHVNNGETPLSGDFTIASGATLEMAGSGGTLTFGPASSISGAGTLAFRDGTTTFTGDCDLSGNVSINGGTINFAKAVELPAVSLGGGSLAGTITANKAFNWTAGVLRGNMVAKGGIIWPSGASGMIIGGTLTLPAGQVAELHDSGYRLSLSEGGAFINQGTLNATGSGISRGPGATTTFDNQGTFNVNLADASRTFTIEGGTTTFRNSGTVNVIRGKLQFGSHVNNGETPLSGDFTIASGATLEMAGSGGTLTFGPASSISGAGTLAFRDGTTTFTGDCDLSGNVSINGGTINFAKAVELPAVSLGGGSLAGTITANKAFNWTAGVLNASVTARGGLSMASSGSLYLGGTLTNAEEQTANFTNGVLCLKSQGALINHGTLNIIDNALRIEPSEAGKMPFTNTGTLNIRLANSSSVFTVGTNIEFTNTGLIDIQQGKLLLDGSLDQRGGTIQFSGGSLQCNTNLHVKGGTLAGSGTVSGAVVLGGTLSPGHSAGTINITGSLTLDAGAHITFDLGDSSDLITVGGNLLKGTSGNYIFDFAAEPNARLGLYRLIDFNGTTTFSAGDFIYTGGLEGNFVLDGHSLSFNVTVIPEPAGLAVLGLTALGLMRRRRAA